MATSPFRIIVDPQDGFGNSITAKVAITNSAGSTPTAYTDDAQTSTQAIGWISSSTNYYLADPDTYTISVTYRGQEIARSGNRTSVANLYAEGEVHSIAPQPSNSLVEGFFVNEGTESVPYWTPTHIGTGPIWGVETDFRDGVGVAVGGTAMSVTLAGSGVRVFGQGHADTDSGLAIQAAGEGGITARMTTTNEAAHLLALGMDAGVMQPDQHGTLTVDVEFTNVSAITDRAMFVGFLGTAADALDPAVTGSTTTATLVQDDLAGVFFDTGLTDADRWYGVHNKSNEAATQDLTADGDTSTDCPAAGTYQRIRVEISPAGAMTVYADKSVIYTNSAALDADEECTPVFYLESNAAAVKTADVRRFSAWAYR